MVIFVDFCDLIDLGDDCVDINDLASVWVVISLISVIWYRFGW